MPYTGKQLHQRTQLALVRVTAAAARLEQRTAEADALEGTLALYAAIPAAELTDDEVADRALVRLRLTDVRRRLEELTAQHASALAVYHDRNAEEAAHRAALPPSDPDAMIPPPRARRDIDGP